MYVNRYKQPVVNNFVFAVVNTSFAQKGKDTIDYNMHIVKDRLIYGDSITVNNHKSAVLDSAAKNGLKVIYGTAGRILHKQKKIICSNSR